MYCEVETWLVVYPDAVAIALNVSLLVIVMGFVYLMLDVVGVVPSIV